jgi:hypothetical protein
VATVFTAAVVLSGCGGSASAGVASIDVGGAQTTPASNSSSPADREAALLKAAQCMRDSGVKDYPDPVVDSSGNVQRGQGGAQFNRNDPTVRKAFTACQSLFQAARPQFSPEQRQELQDALLAFAKCVRANGYNMPDPTFDGTPGQGRGPFQGVNANDPAFRKARTACQDKLNGVFPGGGGPGGNPGGPPPGGAQ